VVYVQEHAKSLRAYHVDYREQHREQHREYMRAHRLAHPEFWRDTWAKCRALRRGAAVSDLTERQWQAIKAMYGHKCVYCSGKPKRLEKDHIIPVSRGGHHTASNVVPCCRSCNSKKYTGPPLVPVQPVLGLW
jgi:5-methylcytosine-specific restriction endonuclease McrA